MKNIKNKCRYIIEEYWYNEISRVAIQKGYVTSFMWGIPVVRGSIHFIPFTSDERNELLIRDKDL